MDMNFYPKKKPRLFSVGSKRKVTIKDCGQIELSYDEQITFISKDGHEYDVARKDWGFYATPSLNRRLPSFNLRAALVKNQDTLFYIMLVEKGKETIFEKYIKDEESTIICWMDNTEDLLKIDSAFK